MAQWDGGALPSPECRETYKGRPEDAQRTLRGRSEALRGRSEGVQRRAESLRGRSEDAQRTFRGAQRTFRGRSEALRGRSEDSQRTFRGRAEGGAWLAVDTAQAQHLGEAFEEPRALVGCPRAVGVASEDARAKE